MGGGTSPDFPKVPKVWELRIRRFCWYKLLIYIYIYYYFFLSFYLNFPTSQLPTLFLISWSKRMEISGDLGSWEVWAKIGCQPLWMLGFATSQALGTFGKSLGSQFPGRVRAIDCD